MTVDEPSSQDATLIDDDLVAALGFEPVTTIESSNGHVDEVDFVAVVDEAVVDEPVVDEPAVAPTGEVEEPGDDLDLREDSADGAELNNAEGIVDVQVETETDEVDPSLTAGSFFDLDEVDQADDDDDDAVTADAGGLTEPSDPAITDDETVDDASAELALDEKLLGVDLDVDDDAGEVDDVADVIIDLDVDDESTPSDGVIELDPVEERLADADDVFADSVVADFDMQPSTESLDLVDLDAGSVAVGAAAIGGVSAELFDAELPDGAALDETDAAAVAVAAVPNSRRRRLRARKSRRVIRHIDPWSVLTFSVLFHMCVFAAMLLSSVLVWNAATASGMIENIESFIQELGDYETFEINADVMFRAAVVIAGMLTLASSVLVVLLTVVFNLISDLVGGIRVTVIEEETVRVPIDKKRSKAAVE